MERREGGKCNGREESVMGGRRAMRWRCIMGGRGKLVWAGPRLSDGPKT